MKNLLPYFAVGALVCLAHSAHAKSNARPGYNQTPTRYHDIPTAQLSLYPDSGHGALFQYSRLFASQVDTFLDGPQ
jgi:hypothetical protein